MKIGKGVAAGLFCLLVSPLSFWQTGAYVANLEGDVLQILWFSFVDRS